MPGWFFIFGQAWFWTLGLPAMGGVIAVAAVWGVPGWTALPVWVFLPSAAIVAMVFQYVAFLAISRLRRRIAEESA
jgi:hypothetical protein